MRLSRHNLGPDLVYVTVFVNLGCGFQVPGTEGKPEVIYRGVTDPDSTLTWDPSRPSWGDAPAIFSQGQEVPCPQPRPLRTRETARPVSFPVKAPSTRLRQSNKHLNLLFSLGRGRCLEWVDLPLGAQEEPGAHGLVPVSQGSSNVRPAPGTTRLHPLGPQDSPLPSPSYTL